MAGRAHPLRPGFLRQQKSIVRHDCPFDPQGGPLFIRETIKAIDSLRLPKDDLRPSTSATRRACSGSRCRGRRPSRAGELLLEERADSVASGLASTPRHGLLRRRSRMRDICTVPNGVDLRMSSERAFVPFVFLSRELFSLLDVKAKAAYLASRTAGT